jgi:hypothetical protein
MTPKKVLMVVSDHGFHWDELADAFHVFKDAGLQMQMASPGGHPKADPRSLKAHLILHWAGIGTLSSRAPSTTSWGRPVVEAIMRTLKLQSVNLKGYDFVFVAGGRGAYLDLKENSELARILGQAIADGLWVAGEAKMLHDYEPIASRFKKGSFNQFLLSLDMSLGLVVRLGFVGLARVFLFRSSFWGRKAAARVVRAIEEYENPALRNRVAEFLDHASGRPK